MQIIADIVAAVSKSVFWFGKCPCFGFFGIRLFNLELIAW